MISAQTNWKHKTNHNKMGGGNFPGMDCRCWHHFLISDHYCGSCNLLQLQKDLLGKDTWLWIWKLQPMGLYGPWKRIWMYACKKRNTKEVHKKYIWPVPDHPLPSVIIYTLIINTLINGSCLNPRSKEHRENINTTGFRTLCSLILPFKTTISGLASEIGRL